jgi:uracil-DNA glycosylase family 4
MRVKYKKISYRKDKRMQKPLTCQPCPLYSFSNGFIESEGQDLNGVAIVGEAAGYNEYIDAKPFRPYAQAGSKLEEVFRLVAGETGQPCSRSQFLLYNMVNCNPPRDELAGRSYEGEAVRCCSQYLDRLFETHLNKNRVILALGNIPLKYLCGVSGIAEEKQSIQHLRGYVFRSKYGLVVPGLHPAFIRRGNPHLTPLLVADMKKALGVARGEYTSYSLHKGYVPPLYQTSPGLDEARSFYYRCKDNPKLAIAYDIETPMSASIDEDEREEEEGGDISLVQFSLKMGEGITLPFRQGYTEVIRDVLALPNVKVGHNVYNFDNPRLKAKGLRIEGKVHDTMWMWKHWQPSLPRGLQAVVSLLGFPFAWKHLYGSQLEWYAAADVDAVQWILHKLPKMMKARGVWEGYINHVTRIHPILDRASSVGIPVDESKRLALEKDFKERREEIHRELQRVIPLEVRNVRPKRKDENGETDYGYIREPKVIAEEYARYSSCTERLREEGRRVVTFGEYLWRKHNLTFAEFENRDKTTGVTSKIERWCVIEEFKASSAQLIRYLKWKQGELKGEKEGLVEERLKVGGRSPELTGKVHEIEKMIESYEVPKDLKTKRDTTNKKELEVIYEKTGDKVLEMVVKIRSYDINLNNYIPNWKPSKDGKVHTTWGYTAPTGQFDSRGPNILNCSKHTEFGNEFRGIIEAPQGYCFVEFDKRSYHIGTMGYCANDKDYIRYSQLDPHSIFGSHIDPSIIGVSIDLKWSDKDILSAAAEFKKRCKEIKAKDPQHNVDVRQELAKPTVLGNQLGLGATKLQWQNRKFIKTIRDAEKMQATLAGMFPKVEVFKVEIKNKAFTQRYLIDEFGRIQYFYDVFVFQWNKKQGKWWRKEGEGAREPVAFRVQGVAFSALQMSMLNLEDMHVNEEFNFCNTIHDSLIFMPEISKRDKCIEVVYSELLKPCPKLVNEATGPLGLVIGTGVSIGHNWKAYDKEKNPEGMQEVKVW